MLIYIGIPSLASPRLRTRESLSEFNYSVSHTRLVRIDRESSERVIAHAGNLSRSRQILMWFALGVPDWQLIPAKITKEIFSFDHFPSHLIIVAGSIRSSVIHEISIHHCVPQSTALSTG